MISTSAVVSITVNPLNDAPTAVAQSVEVDEDTSQLITLVGLDAEDLEGEGLSYELVELHPMANLYSMVMNLLIHHLLIGTVKTVFLSGYRMASQSQPQQLCRLQ